MAAAFFIHAANEAGFADFDRQWTVTA